MTRNEGEKGVISSKASAISRREFARRAALASAATALSPSIFVPAAAAPAFGGDARTLLQDTPDKTKLSPEGQIEMQARAEAIFARYGKRLSDDQKKDILRLQTVLQPQLESLRAYSLSNGDAPALYLKPLVEREKLPSAAKPAAPAKR